MKSSKATIIYALAAFLALIFLWLSLVALWLGKQQNLVKADAIVVLGAAAYHVNPSPVFAERIKYGIHLYRQKLAPKIIFTGGFGVKAQFAESEVAQRFALKEGVAASDILLEKSSRNTLENLIETQKIMQANNLQSVIIVSDPLHLPRAMRIAKKIGIKAYAAATPSTKFQTLHSSWRFLAQEIYLWHRDLIW